MKKQARADGLVIIKKYANRRLYNTKSSSYITLDHLASMTREEVEFKVIDAKTDSFVFEVTGNTEKVQTFIGLMESLGLVDVGRTGIVAMSRGGEAL